MIGRVGKWLGYSLKFSITLGELLVIIALVTLVNAVWPSVPFWVFFLLGAAMTLTGRAACDLRRWIRRRGTA